MSVTRHYEKQKFRVETYSISKLIFNIFTISISSLLRKMKSGCIIDDMKTSSLLFMNNLKLFLKNRKVINSLVSTVQVISKEICI